MVIDVRKPHWSNETYCKIRYPNGLIDELWMRDLFKDPEDDEDDEYSVCIDEVQHDAQDRED